jgi:hypothetical protein
LRQAFFIWVLGIGYLLGWGKKSGSVAECEGRPGAKEGAEKKPHILRVVEFY